MSVSNDGSNSNPILNDELEQEVDALLASLDEPQLDEEEIEEEEVEETEEPSGPKFTDFAFAPAVRNAVEKLGFETPTEVQSRAIPSVLAGKDVLVTAQTGSGKTAAFLAPILTKMLEAAEEKKFRKALIIAPTRELAEQISQVARDFTFFARRFRYATIIGGSGYGRQLQQLRDRPAFVIGTPGRLIDHIERGTLKLENFDFLVLDEADRMLDMGFEPQIEQIVKALPESRQTMMFSATLPPEVKRLVSRYLKEPVRISVGEENRPVASIKQDMVELRETEKADYLLKEIDKLAGTMIIFTKTKMKADRMAAGLNQHGHQADALHGDLTQGARRRVTMNFREEKIRILVATDIAARGLDIDHVAHVINYDLPMVQEDYIHRIGRTGRAGREGHSIAFVTPGERMKWARILKMMGLPAPRMSGGGGNVSRDRGGRRNDGKFSRPRPEGRGFRDRRDEGGDREFRQRPQARPYDGGDSRPGARVDTRPMRSDSRPQYRDDSRPQRFERAERPVRAERPQQADRPRPLRAAERPGALVNPEGNRAERRARKFGESGGGGEKRAWSKGGGDRRRDDSHKRLPFKREGEPRADRSADGPRTWDADAAPKRPAGPKRFGKQRDENWGKPWNPRGPVKAPAAASSRRERF